MFLLSLNYVTFPQQLYSDNFPNYSYWQMYFIIYRENFTATGIVPSCYISPKFVFANHYIYLPSMGPEIYINVRVFCLMSTNPLYQGSNFTAENKSESSNLIFSFIMSYPINGKWRPAHSLNTADFWDSTEFNSY